MSKEEKDKFGQCAIVDVQRYQREKDAFREAKMRNRPTLAIEDMLESARNRREKKLQSKITQE